MDAEKTITLRSGGKLTVKAEFDPFGLSAEDRAFVYGLCDNLANYESGAVPTLTPLIPSIPTTEIGVPAVEAAYSHTAALPERRYGE